MTWNKSFMRNKKNYFISKHINVIKRPIPRQRFTTILHYFQFLRYTKSTKEIKLLPCESLQSLRFYQNLRPNFAWTTIFPDFRSQKPCGHDQLQNKIEAPQLTCKLFRITEQISKDFDCKWPRAEAFPDMEDVLCVAYRGWAWDFKIIYGKRP